MTAAFETASPLLGSLPFDGKTIQARFDGGELLSDGGALTLREIEARLASPIGSAAARSNCVSYQPD